MLAEFGCDDAQGSYVGPAMARPELTRWLSQPTRPPP